MAALVLGPLLRHVSTTSATVWVQTDAPCEVTVAGATARTFRVGAQHYALVVIDGLTPGSSIPYQLHLEGALVWPEPGSALPQSRINTPKSTMDRPFRMLFGSCRLPEATSAWERHSFGVDALVAYASRMAHLPAAEWPDALLLLGDQVYADKLTSATGKWVAARRPGTEPTGEVADFAEYVRLYEESWSQPLVRWLMSTVPVSMIFDDHDVRDDWNTSQSWRERMARTPWWPRRIRAGLASYWVYQHIGNLSPDELAEDEMFAKVTSGAAEQDMYDVLAEFAGRADEELDGHKSTRWSYFRDFGAVRLLVIDTRSGRILADGARSMTSDAEFDWIEQHATGEHEHLVVGSSLPWLLPPMISHLQSWNERECRRADWRGRFGEWARQRFDLEHWPSFRTSFDRLSRLLHRVALGGEGRRPASVLVLSGDVHHVYAARADYPGDDGAGIYQLTCSPVRGKVPWPMKLVFRLSWRSWPSRLVGALVRRAGVPDSPVRWDRLTGPHFANIVATLSLHERRATLLLESAHRSTAGPVLRQLPAVPLK